MSACVQISQDLDHLDNFLKLNGTKYYFSPPCKEISNGTAENNGKSFKLAIQKALFEGQG